MIQASDPPFLRRLLKLGTVVAGVLGQTLCNGRAVSVSVRTSGPRGSPILDRRTESSWMVQAAFVAGSAGKMEVGRLAGTHGPSFATSRHLAVGLAPETDPQHTALGIPATAYPQRHAPKAPPA